VPPFEKTPADVQELLAKPIRELGLKLEGSALEKYVRALYREIDRKGLKQFRPACYLTDEWGCPSGEPVVGIPFYLADPKLASLERQMNDLEDEREIMMYLRHEAGHAFNYAYELYKSDEWRLLFGPFRRAYKEHYRPVPFSRRYVRHIAGWYAQKHPDEDFAETFAVWLTPRSGWRRKYVGWPAMAKLRYVDRQARRVADLPPLRPLGATDVTVEQMDVTVEQFYHAHTPDEAQAIAQRHPAGRPVARGAAQGNRGQGHLLDGSPAAAGARAGGVDRTAGRGARPGRGDGARDDAARGDDRLRHDAGDELPDPRTLRPTMRRA
jgi:hypothetical protein